MPLTHCIVTPSQIGGEDNRDEEGPCNGAADDTHRPDRLPVLDAHHHAGIRVLHGRHYSTTGSWLGFFIVVSFKV